MTWPVIETLPSMRPRISSEPSPLTLPRTTVAVDIVDGEFMAAPSDVHVDVALEGRTVRYRQARRAHVAYQATACLQINAVGSRYITGDIASHTEACG